MDDPKPVGVGSPQILYLHEFGRLVEKVFGSYPHLVGSALKGKQPRDIDVRVQVDNLRFTVLFPDTSAWCRPGSQWAVVCMAFSALGRDMTRLPIDFQIQHPALYNNYKDEPRLEIGRDPPHNKGLEDYTLSQVQNPTEAPNEPKSQLYQG